MVRKMSELQDDFEEGDLAPFGMQPSSCQFWVFRCRSNETLRLLKNALKDIESVVDDDYGRLGYLSTYELL